MSILGQGCGEPGLWQKLTAKSNLGWALLYVSCFVSAVVSLLCKNLLFASDLYTLYFASTNLFFH